MSKSHLLQIRLEESHKTSLEQVCHSEKISISEKIRELIQEHLTTEMTSTKMKPIKKFIPSWDPEIKKKSFTVGEMYSGPGGIGLALSQT